KAVRRFGVAAVLLLLLTRLRFALGDNRRKNRDTFLSFANMPAKPEPCAKPCNMSCIRPLHGDEQAVRPGILVKPGRYVQVGREHRAVSGFEGCGERSECVRSDFCGNVLGVHVILPFNKCPAAEGERRDERLSSIGVGTWRGT